jgi:kynurenine formamidase
MADIVDLTQEIYEGQPVYHTHQQTVTWRDTSFEDIDYMLRKELDEDPPFTFETNALLLCEHGPTHVDAPRHFRPDGDSIEELPLERFHTPGKAIDVSHRGPGEYITVDDIESACEDADVAVEQGDTVLLRTGHYDETHPTREYSANYPGLNADATQWLIDHGVVNFGVDQPSPDTPDDPTYPCHSLCRDHDLPHMENLKNIDRVVGDSFTFLGFPLPIRDGTGSPIRAVALLED